MKSSSFVEFANAESRKLGLITSVLVTVACVAVFVLVIVFQYNTTIRNQVKGQTESFGFWVVTNDQFQMSRSLKNLVQSNGLVAGRILDRYGAVVKESHSQPQSQGLFDYGQFHLQGLHLNLLVSYNLFSRQGPLVENVGQLQVIFPIRLGELLGLLFVLVAGLSLLNYFIRLRFLALAKTLGAPVEELAFAVSRWDSTPESNQILNSKIQFKEFEVLATELVGLSSRLRDKEQEISRVEQARDLYEMARHVAHDIRSPVSALNAIVSSSTQLPEDSRSIIVAVAERITNIANDLLKKHRNKQSNAISSVRPIINLTDLIRNLSLEKNLKSKETQVDFQVRVGGIPCVIAADPLKLNRAISNIIDNAFEACNGRGYVAVSLEPSQLFNSATLTIEDSGGGIPESILSHVFEGPVKSTKPEGNGLGLHSAIKTIQEENGQVRIENIANTGARIHISFQITDSNVKQA